MVLIAEISEAGKRADAHGDAEARGEEKETAENPQPPPPPPPPPPPVPANQAAARPPYSEYALRVAYIMRSYMYMSQGGTPGVAPAAVTPQQPTPPESDRCRAMMEVVRKDGPKWVVSKLIHNHNHVLDIPPDPTGSTAGLVPSIGMEFDSVAIAKAFYTTYAEKLGFKARAGAGRRSKDNRMLVVQRFFCSKGNCLPNKANPGGTAAKESCRRRTRKKRPPQEPEVVEVVDLESSPSKSNEALNASPENVAGLAPSEATPTAETSQDDGNGSLGGNAPPVSNPGQSRLLRELGVRVSKYTNEERRNIITKYMNKRSNRQAVDRSIKIPSRQALAERRQRGIGGKFLSKEEMMQALTRQEEVTEEEELEVSAEDVANAGGVPIVGMVFDTEDKAYEYYVNYAGNIGFSVRKGLWEKCASTSTKSRIYACSRERSRSKSATNGTRKPRSDIRCGCPARMAIKITSRGKYRVTEFVPDHNHQLATPLDIQMFKSQKFLTKCPTGNCQNAKLIPAEYKNYLRSKRTNDMQVGDAGAILQYLQKMKGNNPSFYYAIQVDEDDQMSNIFWTDAKSIIDYYYFGDVVCFDTTYNASDCERPFALFLGVNHHKQIVVFGAAFIYDETIESFKWLFETFNTAMSGRQPKTVFTGHCAAISDAVSAVWPGTRQRLCAWQIYQDAIQHLGDIFQQLEPFLHDFSQCVYDIEEREEFLSSWVLMLEKYKLQENEWLAKIYEEREKWALAYGREVFCADMTSTLRRESLNGEIKEYLSSLKDLSQFFTQFERLVNERRCAELQADYHANYINPRIPSLRLLWQASNAYTPALFEMFRKEFELFMDCMVYTCGEVGPLSDYEVLVKEKTKAHVVRFDSSDGTVTCTCRRFESIGIQCCHVLKVLDFRNIKDLPPQYILKRWRKDAKAGAVRESHGFALDGDPKSSLAQRYSSLCRMLYRIASRAAENVEAFTLMVSQSDQLIEQVERILQTRLLEKASVNNPPKGQAQNLIESGSTPHDNNDETQRTNGKKRKDASARRRPQNALDSSKRLKGRKGQSDEAEFTPMNNEALVAPSSILSQPRNPSTSYFTSSHFMQGPYVTGHQFGLGTAQGYHTMTQFGQDSSVSALQQQQHQLQQQLHGNVQLSQNPMQAYTTTNMHHLHYAANNPELDPQGGDQAPPIAVWDFLR